MKSKDKSQNIAPIINDTHIITFHAGVDKSKNDRNTQHNIRKQRVELHFNRDRERRTGSVRYGGGNIYAYVPSRPKTRILPARKEGIVIIFIQQRRARCILYFNIL